MPDEYAKAEAAAAFVRKHQKVSATVGLMTGTGLGESMASMQVHARVGYEQIPHFPRSTVTGHAGQLLVGELAGLPVLAMQGRVHLYEGYTPLEVTFPIRVMQQLGVRHLVVTNAAGGLNPAYVPGQLMVVSDHINLTGENPLVGPNEDRWGIRFPDMSAVYDAALMDAATNAADDEEIVVSKGVYAGLKGPSLETPAEVRYLQSVGADAVGFSTVMEVIAAVHAGMSVLGLSIITNVHDPDQPQPATVEEIIATAHKATRSLERIMTAALPASV